jgi:tRNA pseudouridine38-40 synthase
MPEAKSIPPRRWKCVCAYDGAPFSGWQCQEDGKGIQDVIEARLAQILEKPVRIEASGRTDAGVHARAQVFHFDAEWRHGAERFHAALRSCLPPGIQIVSLRPTKADFHARFSATGKRYIYYLHLGDADPFTRPYTWPILRPLDIEAMRAAAAVLVGKQDFRAFTAYNGKEREDTVRHIRRLDVVRRGKIIRLIVEGDGFLYKMVRSIAGALVKVGEGRSSPAEVKAILVSRQRTEAVLTAPPQGLFLDKVFYT